MIKNTIKLMLMAIAMVAMFTACNDDDNNEFEVLEKTDIFTLVDSKTIMLNGVINTKSLDEFNALYEENKTVTTINIKNCDGSINDEVNLELSKRIHDLKLNTHLMDNGLIASGGVDFFLAGIKRTAGENTKIGVHSWLDGSQSATDYPEGHEFHLPYIIYYEYVGFTEAEAKAFYYFTINSASAESIHYMTEDEIAKYKILTTEESYLKTQIIGTWEAEDISSEDKTVEVVIYDDTLFFGNFKRVQAQWSLLAVKGMNTFRYTLKDNIVYGTLELSNGAIDRYRRLNLNKEMIDLAESWNKEEREVFKIVSLNETTMKIRALSRNGKDYIEQVLTKK